jgi:multiple sugar transport system substrate-binding protein
MFLRNGHRWANLFLLIVLGLLLTAGCGREAGQDGNIIRFVTWKPNNPEVWDKIIGLFEQEHPGLRVAREIGPHSSSAYHDLLTQKLKNRDPGLDVFFLDVIWPQEFASAGWAQPLDPLFPPEEQKQFIPAPILANTFQGKCYGVPVFIDTGLLYYRKDLLAQYSFRPPRTWDELVEQARVIVAGEKARGRDLSGFSGQFKQYEGLVCNLMEYIESNRGRILDASGGKSLLDREEALEAVRFVRDRIIGQAAPRGVLTYEEPESLAPFVQGKGVFLRSWPYAWSIAADPQKSLVAGKVGISRLPHFPGGKSVAALGGWQLGISRYSRNREKAWTFVRFVTSPRIQKLLALEAGLAPTRQDLYQDEQVLKANPQFAEMKEVFWTATPRPRTPLYPAVSNVLQRFFSQAIANPSSDIPGLMKTAGKEINNLMALTR